VGGAHPHGFAQPGAPGADDAPAPGTPAFGEEEAARTAVRPRTSPLASPASASGDDDLDAGASELGLPSAGLPGWIKALTVLAVLAFATGLTVYLVRRNAGENAASGSAVHSDVGGSAASGAGPGPGSGPAADKPATPITGAAPGGHETHPEGPTPPPGMLLVPHPDGTPWFFVDARP